MPSGQDHISRLREETRRKLAPIVRGFEQELRNLETNLAASIASLGRNLESVADVEVPGMETILTDALAEESHRGTTRRAEEMLSLTRFTHEMRRKETQDEILGSLLDAAHRYAPRLVLFVARAQHFNAWSSRGFSSGLTAELAHGCLGFAETPLLQRALEADGLTTASDFAQEPAISGLLGKEGEGPLHAFPLRALGRPVAVLLAASAEGQACDLESICFLMDVTGLGIENVALKVLHEMKVSAAASVPPMSPRVPPVPETVEVPPAAPMMPEVASEGTCSAPIPEEACPVTDQPAALQSGQPEAALSEAASAEPSLPAAAEPRQEDSQPSEAAAVCCQPPVEPVFVESPIVPEPAVISAEMEPARQENPDGPPLSVLETVAQVAEEPPQDASEHARSALLREVQPLTEEEKLHADAKRFARLLATEIKLYNEQRVQEGRTNRDVYVRLKRDIDRSRDMYEKRVSPVVSRKVDYFHDEIIRVLGDNDPSTLGSDYPGPRVES